MTQLNLYPKFNTMGADDTIHKNLIFKYDCTWEELLQQERFKKEFCEDVLESYILNQRWYGGKAS
ncbi:MAG: hypothetical protein V7767_04455, partial [Leeuwenhoekiella sp.]